ncbi:hypothetical protein HPB52_016176 [Rhipicephalus sanguineus]|uniref:BCAS3 domain-containing protein n=1 Tax=Rhipicephalus sanguineus TaxID=34632 RepID=A0A9D4SXL8_RHISA|nr:hypothetical protein HPB52_016176 [Rhipicephalus sanguineus]
MDDGNGKRKRKTITIEQKAAMLKVVKSGVKKKKVAQDFGVAGGDSEDTGAAANEGAGGDQDLASWDALVDAGVVPDCDTCTYVSADADAVTTEELTEAEIVRAVTGVVNDDSDECVDDSPEFANPIFGAHDDGEDGLDIAAAAGKGIIRSSSSSLEKYASGGSLRRLGPQPTLVSPLAQIKQGTAFSVAGIGAPQNSPPRGRRPSGPATKEAFSIAAAFAPPRAWLVGSPSTSRDKKEKNPVDSLFIMTCNGALTEYIIDPRPCSSVNKVTEDSPIELDVTAYAQWNLLRPPMSHDTKQPLSSNNPLMMGGQVATNTSTGKQSFKDINGMSHMEGSGRSQKENDDSWLSQVEIITHVGPHRRLWMGPQFSFKTLQTPANTPLSSQHSQGSDKYTPLSPDSYGEDSDVQSPGFSGPMSVPVAVPAMSHYLSDSAFPPLLIEATSGSFEGPPSLLEVCGHWSDSSGASSHANGQEQLMERIADAMNESPYKERQAARTSSGSELACFEDVGSRCNSDVSLYHSPSQSTEHLLVFSSTQQDSM